jgi:hypothetical protein
MATNPELADLIEAGLIIPTPDKLKEAEPTVRNIIAGHPQAAIRRIVLYFILIIFIGLSAVWYPFVIAASATAALLLASDQLA